MGDYLKKREREKKLEKIRGKVKSGGGSRKAGIAKLREKYKDDPRTLATLDAAEHAEKVASELKKMLPGFKVSSGNALTGKGYYGAVKLVVVGSASAEGHPLGKVLRGSAHILSYDSEKESPKQTAKRAHKALGHYVGPVPASWPRKAGIKTYKDNGNGG